MFKSAWIDFYDDRRSSERSIVEFFTFLFQAERVEMWVFVEIKIF